MAFFRLKRAALAVGLVLTTLGGACGRGAPSAEPARSAPPGTKISVAPPPKAPEVVSVSTDAGSAAAEEPEDFAEVRVPVVLAADGTRCALTFEAAQASESETHWTLTGIRRIGAERGEHCQAQTLFDGEHDRPDDPDEPAGFLEAALVPKPGKLEAFLADVEGGLGSALEDVNFDGRLDLRVLRMSGNYTSTFRFWLYDPVSRSFVASPELDALFSPSFDPATRTVSEGGRASGSLYFSATYQWIAGKLEPMTRSRVWLGEKPDGSPLPRGFHRWEIRFERKNGVFGQSFEGPVR